MGKIIKNNHTPNNDPNAPVTRGEAALELYRLARKKGYKVPFALGASAEKDTAWTWAVSNGFIRRESKVIEEQERDMPLNRAEAAYMFYKFGEYSKKLDQTRGH